MQKKLENQEHPGNFIRDGIIPTGMSVTDAAKKMGVGRPALSNLLNGKASLSSDMAVRLEKSFGADREKLLALQSAFDRHDRRGKENTVIARAYVPGFLIIKARQIHDWAESHHDARRLLPVLLRKLVHSTDHHALRQVDFPGYDNAERKGWDGLIEAGAATPWVPEGKSGWEISTNKQPKNKAERDYAARLGSVSPAERAECTFVFVTARNWPGKNDWAKKKRTAGDWKAVRVFDASDLEQWLEDSISAQMWLAEQLAMPMPVNGFETLERCWQRWEEASDPKMVREIFEPSVIAYRNPFKEWLEKPSEKPFMVAADSKDEALAFLACLFRDNAIAQPSGSNTAARDLAAVFESAQTLKKLAASSVPLIPIVCTEEAEQELSSVYRQRRCIIVRPRNAIDSKPDIALELLDHNTFEKALAAMGITGDRAEQLARESGHSPTILRRRLSKLDAIRKPQWSTDAKIARSLIPMALVGAWHTTSQADCEVISTLAGGRPYQQTEESIADLVQREDSPVWSTGQCRGVASKVDALFAINKHVTKENLDKFFRLAEYVLSENDPALELPEDKRWAAGLYGKVRHHSAALREGICETLVIFSVYGNTLFQDRLGIDVADYVSSLIRKILTPLSLDKLLSHNNDLPHYAEAAPDEFLNLLEEDLRQPQPVVLGLLKPTESSLFDTPTRSGLLWALECLAWKHFGRVNLILAQLSEPVINDNWVNKPIASLESIYRWWLPQTAASLEDRIRALEALTKRFPDIGWQICIEQLREGLLSGHYSYRPRWRNDASGAGKSVPPEADEFGRKALDLALAWPRHNQKTLGDLVERLPKMLEENQTLVWNLIDAWADSEADEKAKAYLREQIRRLAFTRRSRWHDLKDATKDRARVSYEKLRPRDSVVRHAWLFDQHWVEPHDDEIKDENFDYSKHEERTRKLRTTAMKEIWAEREFEGVTSLLSCSKEPATVGDSLRLHITATNVRVDFLQQCLSITGDLERKIDLCMQGFLTSLEDETCGTILSAVVEDRDAEQIVRLFRCAPFGQDTWRLLDRYGEEALNRYWQEVLPYWARHSEAERSEIIDRLLAAKRPRAAFHAVHLDWSQIEASRLKRLLRAVATVDDEPEAHYRLEPYYVSEALSSLNGRTGVSPDEMAQLEFMFVEVLNHSKHGIPNLERQIAESPATFVQMLAFAFKRNDDGQDPPEWRTEDPGRLVRLASIAYRLLDRIGRIPGTGQDGKVNTETLLAWVTEVRQLCDEHGRDKIGDQKIGQLLSKASAEEDGGWPCLPVCEVMEKIASRQIGTGFNIGICNGRGAHLREDGGTQERRLAAQYRGWANQRAFNYPYVSSVLESVAADYDREARRWDAETKIEKRLRH